MTHALETDESTSCETGINPTKMEDIAFSSLNLSDPEGLLANSTGINPIKIEEVVSLSPVKKEAKDVNEISGLQNLSEDTENSDEDCKYFSLLMNHVHNRSVI